MDLARVLANLLLWAHTLAEVTAEWSHTTDHRLHVSVLGRATTGARFRVYGGGLFAYTLGLVDLDAGERDGVSLDELYALVCLLREVHSTREAA
ncbi:hypothetical protein BU204_13485 [Actinophytocola xanthii]|uniref:Uncharacterized protein n=2 Tax=Actinophytocola xanthii TaxID=1912961 RepID=A0A1Q8CS23_9PSEU|nr:hypothetical protein BU204_13485 [Actinophytocola xanthii]